MVEQIIDHLAHMSQFDELFFENLQRITKRQFDKTHKLALQLATVNYVSWCRYQRSELRTKYLKNIQADQIKVPRHAQALADALQTFVEKYAAKSGGHMHGDLAMSNLGKIYTPEFIAILTKLAEDSKHWMSALNKPPRKAGRPPASHARALLMDLAHIYSTVGGKIGISRPSDDGSKLTGQFVGYLRCVYVILPADCRSKTENAFAETAAAMIKELQKSQTKNRPQFFDPADISAHLTPE